MNLSLLGYVAAWIRLVIPKVTLIVAAGYQVYSRLPSAGKHVEPSTPRAFASENLHIDHQQRFFPVY